MKKRHVSTMKKRHVLLILAGFIPLAVVILIFVLVLAMSAWEFIWGWLFRVAH